MSIQQARLDSYFSLPTDLASEMRDWPEFVEGKHYDLELRTGAEKVSVRLMEAAEDDRAHVIVRGEGSGYLFDKVLGRVVYAMAAHSDDVVVMRWRDDPV
jgi:hypothetical protein